MFNFVSMYYYNSYIMCMALPMGNWRLKSSFSSFMFLLFFLLLHFTPTITAQSPIYMYTFCHNSTTGKSPTTSYQSNVNNFLSWVTSDSITGTVYNETIIGNNGDGDGDAAVYGNYNCRGDLSGYFCQFCLTTAAREIAQRCPNTVTAMIWYDICIIRCSNYNFFGKISLTPAWNVSGSKTIKDSTELRKAQDDMRGTITKLTSQNQYWGIVEFNWNNTEKRYGLLQCSKDLTSHDCRQCLETLLDIVPLCCETKVSWAIMAPSCGMKFDDYRFYQITNQTGTGSPSLIPNPGTLS